MKLDHLLYSRLLGRPYHPGARRFEAMRQSALASAGVVVSHVLDITPARSVIDVGCWTGLWLSVFAQRGVERIVGVDGDYVSRDRLEIDPASWVSWDLNRPLGGLNLGRFDLAMSLEVGEHLTPERADSLVDDLCALSDVVLYGAAIVEQGGEDHINEQWQSYWVTKFLNRGYLAYDVLRPLIWAAPDVAYWYKQNAIFYVKRDSAAHAHFQQRFKTPSTSMFDVVHPELYWRNVNAKRGLRRLAKNSRRIFSQLTGLRLYQPPRHVRGDDDLVLPRHYLQ
jgi:hypothetical protein